MDLLIDFILYMTGETVDKKLSKYFKSPIIRALIIVASFLILLAILFYITQIIF